MSNQNRLLSDEELREKIIFALYSHQIGKTIEKKLPGNYLLNLINTQKRLYAESVIGDSDVAMVMTPPIGIGVDGRSWTDKHEEMRKAQYRDQLRAEQRARIK